MSLPSFSRLKPRRQISLLAAQSVHRSFVCPLVPAHSSPFLYLRHLLFLPYTNCIKHFVCTLFPCASSLRIMACDSTCGVPPKALPAVVRIPTQSIPNIDIGGSAVTCDQDTSCQPQPNGGANDCHTSSAKCTPEKNGCCSSKSVNVEAHDQKRPSCCEGKLSPCCDSSCIERIALRECATESKVVTL